MPGKYYVLRKYWLLMTLVIVFGRGIRRRKEVSITSRCLLWRRKAIEEELDGGPGWGQRPPSHASSFYHGREHMKP